MKTLVVATLALTAFAGAASASELRFFDPTESEFVTVQVNPNAVAPVVDAGRYDRTVTFYDPAEAEFVTVQVGSAQPLIATNDGVSAAGSRSVYDPAEGNFVTIPANQAW